MSWRLSQAFGAQRVLGLMLGKDSTALTTECQQAQSKECFVSRKG